MQVQTFDAGVERAALDSYLVSAGYWGNSELRRRHAYVLSPSVYMLSHEQERSMERLACRTYDAVKCLNRRLVHLASGSQHLSHEEGRFLKLANSASRSLCMPRDGEERIPPVIKVDLIQDPLGHFFIAEVDTYNPRGFGYAALLEDSLPGCAPFRYPGVGGLMKLFNNKEYGAVSGWYIVISEFERYYETAFNVLCRSFAKRGVKLCIVRESDLASGRTVLPESAGVLAIPESMNTHPSVRDYLFAAYKHGNVKFLYPPVAYLGSKAFLPYLRTCIGMNEFIPPTVHVGKRHKDTLPSGEKPAVLKATVSSGMKGVYFSDLDGSEYAQALGKASGLRTTSWILQEQVPQEPLPIVVFTDDGEREVRDYYLRITAYVSENGIIDAEITGRPDRKVHGAPDCIQLPVILNRDLS